MNRAQALAVVVVGVVVSSPTPPPIALVRVYRGSNKGNGRRPRAPHLATSYGEREKEVFM
jgi:hypothetical protein